MIFKFQLGGHFNISIYMSVCHMSYWQDCSWKFNLLGNDMEKKISLDQTVSVPA